MHTGLINNVSKAGEVIQGIPLQTFNMYAIVRNSQNLVLKLSVQIKILTIQFIQNFLSSLCTFLLPPNIGLNQNLLEAAKTVDVSEVKIILHRRADVSARSPNGKTAWLIAESKGRIEVLRLLKGLRKDMA